MSHYESHQSASLKDKLAISQILKLNPEGLYLTVAKNRITMCGVIAVTVMLMACKKLGAKKVDLAKYMTSGEVSGDMSCVVGYAGLVVS